jgi:hypothetical protein
MTLNQKGSVVLTLVDVFSVHPRRPRDTVHGRTRSFGDGSFDTESSRRVSDLDFVKANQANACQRIAEKSP